MNEGNDKLGKPVPSCRVCSQTESRLMYSAHVCAPALTPYPIDVFMDFILRTSGWAWHELVQLHHPCCIVN